ncbi:hypothetical protein ACHAW6_003897 [Cyclotella cf. meneghiniana]
MEEATSQTGPQTLTFANHPQNTPRSKPGPQLWAIVLLLAALYYLWTRILGLPLPSPTRGGGGRRLGSKDDEMAAARERRLARVTSDRGEEGNNARERTAPSPAPSSGSSFGSASELERRQRRRLEGEKQREAEERKRKQRQLYLRKKAELEKQEEERKKDEELGPGWRYRQDPSVLRNVVDGMNPQSGGEGGGGYKPQVCTRRGG